jgi:hypothetical protein
MTVKYAKLVTKRSKLTLFHSGKQYASATTMNLSLAKFDLDSILRANQVISSAVDMDSLLLNIMKIVSLAAALAFTFRR